MNFIRKISYFKSKSFKRKLLYFKSRMKLWSYYSKENIILILVVIAVIAGWLYAQIKLQTEKNLPLDKVFWLSLIPNPVPTMFGILVSTYFVSKLVASSQEKKQKKVLIEIFGVSLIKLTESMMLDYICFLSNASEWKLSHGNRDKLNKYFSELAKDASNLITYKKVMSDVYINVNDINLMQKCFIKNWDDIRYEVDLMLRTRGQGEYTDEEITEDSLQNIQAGRNIKIDRRRFVKELYNSIDTSIDTFFNDFELVLPIEIKRSLYSIKNKFKKQIEYYGNIEGFRLVPDSEYTKELTPFLHRDIVNLTEETSAELVFLRKYFDI